MERKKTIILLISTITLLLVLVIGYMISSLDLYMSDKSRRVDKSSHDHGSHKNESDPDPIIELPKEALKILSIKTVTVKKRKVTRRIETTAIIEPDETKMSHVSPRIPGRVIAVKAFLVDDVKQGEVLAELDSIELGRTKADFLKAKAKLQVARANYEREKRLYEQKISSQKEYLNAKGDFLESEAEFQSFLETLRLFGLTQDEIFAVQWGSDKYSLSHFPLTAPFNGRVIEKHIVLGERITPDDNPYTIADLSKVWIQVDIYENDLRWVDKGINVAVEVTAYPEKEFRGVITYISDILDKSTRTAKARVEIDNKSNLLKPGMFATAVLEIPLSGGDSTMVVPLSSVYSIHGEDVVFVKRGERTYEVRKVILGRNFNDYVEVLNGLKEGEEAVTKGGFQLKSVFLKEELGEEHGH